MLRRPLLGHLAAGLTAATLLGLGCGSALADPPGAAPATPPPVISGPGHDPAHPPAPYAPVGVSADGTDQDALQVGRLTPAQLPPPRPLRSTAGTAARPAAAQAAAQSCTPADFSSRSGAALASYLEASTTDCVDTLFAVRGSAAHGVFQQSQVLPVAEAMRQLAAGYRGDDSTGIQQLVLFLRAAYYVQFNDAADVGSYDAAVSAASTGAMDAFFANPHSQDVTAANAAVLGEVVTLTDSADTDAHYIGLYEHLYQSYNSSWDAVTGMDNAVYNANSALWRAVDNPGFVSAVTADPGLVKTMNTFALGHLDMLGGDNTNMVAGAAQDLAAFIQLPALRATVQPMVLGLLHASRMTGPTAALWVAVAQQTAQFDAANCATYDTCDLPAKLKAAALPINHACSPTLTVTAQALDPGQLAAICTSLTSEATWFQKLVKATGPIPGQTITGEDMVVFSSRQDYQVYGPAIFGIDTDNGGITETGEPNQAGNSAFSVMYQAPYATGFPADVWNLNHEFTHYLDAVYDTRGDFTAETAVPDVWWIEGIAEYTSYTYRGVPETEAMGDAPLHTYALSTLFQNTYENSDTTRTYPWGYLAVRYMWQKHPDVIAAMLGHFRTGDYTGGYKVYNSLGTRYDADFASWLNTLNGSTAGAPKAAFTETVTGLAASFRDTSTETGSGTITGRKWTFGDGATSTAANPRHAYAKPGSYTVTLTVTDSNKQTATTSATVTVGGPTACAGADPRLLGQNCYRADQSAAAGGLDYFYLYLPAGTTTLKVTTTAGTGSAYLYYDPTTWATATNHTAASTHSGTTQTLTVSNTTAGYRYVSLYGAAAFSGVTITTSY